MPAIECHLAAGDEAGARDVQAGRKIPALREEDDFIMQLWQELRSPLSQGAQMDVLRFRCEAVGLRDVQAQVEVWERVNIADAEIRAFHALMASLE